MGIPDTRPFSDYKITTGTSNCLKITRITGLYKKMHNLMKKGLI